MRLSESLSSHLAHIALEAIRRSGAEVRNDRLALAEIKKTLGRQLDQDPRIDEAVRRRIASLQRPVPPGSNEYEVLYRQYYEQETRKHRP
ncbi:MAG: hypothetical protein RL698_2878 [Pseudomonadota bacterium]|jgi:uncharacterized protein